MGTATRIGKNDTENVPGPGNYNVTKGVGEGPKVRLIFIKLSFQWKENIMLKIQIIHLDQVNMKEIKQITWIIIQHGSKLIWLKIELELVQEIMI